MSFLGLCSLYNSGIPHCDNENYLVMECMRINEERSVKDDSRGSGLKQKMTPLTERNM